MSPEAWAWVEKLGLAGLAYAALWFSFKGKWVWGHQLVAKQLEMDTRLKEKDDAIRELKVDRDRLLVICLRNAAHAAQLGTVLERTVPPALIGEKVESNT